MRRLHWQPVARLRQGRCADRATTAPAPERPHQSIPVPLLDRAGVLMYKLRPPDIKKFSRACPTLLGGVLVLCAGRAEIIDRVAVVVGNRVITESEILREVRLTAFLNGAPLDFSAASKRKTAERLVEQRLIRS